MNHVIQVAYDPGLILLSVLVAIFAAYVALSLAYPVTQAQGKTKLVWLGFGSLTMGFGIWSMHFIGMLAFKMPGMEMAYNVPLMILSVLVAVGGSLLALIIISRPRVIQSSVLYGGFAMAIAICGMHYVGMLATTFVHDETAYNFQDTHILVTRGLIFTTVVATFFILGLALVGTITQRIISDRELRSEEKYRLLIEAVKDYAIFIIDENGYITTWNSGAQNITGYSQKEAIGQHMSFLYPANLPENTLELELKLATEKGHFEAETIRRRKDGVHFWANIVIDPLLDKNQKITGFSKVVRDITRMKNLNEELELRVQERTLALQHSEKQLRLITNAVPQLLARLDSNENLLFANSSFCQWFGIEQKDIRKYSFAELLGAERYPANKFYIDRVLKGENLAYERKSRSIADPDKDTILNINFIPEFNDIDEVKGFILVATDVKKYKEIEEALKGAKQEAEVANETKSAFLANMSHEIRTPLGAIIGFSELLTDPKTKSTEKENMIGIIKRNGKLLSTIINDILDLSKVEAGKLQIEKIDVRLKDLLNDVSHFLNLEATGKGLELYMEPEEDLPVAIKTDPTRLRQILFNIVGNAIKFTEKGFIKIKVKKNPENAQQILFSIQDTGTGISEAQANKLFSPFTQADATTTRKFGGTGLGLVLSKKLAKALGGDVVLESSTIGFGSTFVITINQGETTMQATELSPKAAVNLSERTKDQISDLTGVRALLVDDSDDNLELLQHILNLAGVKVDLAKNGQEGVKKALENNYDIVLMDLQMPVMDGYEATKLLREKNYSVPIIALTAHAMKEEREKTEQYGFNDHVTKPIDRGVLLSTISHYTNF